MESIDVAVKNASLLNSKKYEETTEKNRIFYGVTSYVSKSVGFWHLGVATLNGLCSKIHELLSSGENPYDTSGTALAIWISCGIAGYFGGEYLEVMREHHQVRENEINRCKIIKIPYVVD